MPLRHTPRLSLAALLLMLLLTGLRPGPAAAAPPAQTPPEIGTVAALALDDSGNGWAWAFPAPQTFATNFLLRIENGTWREATASEHADDILVPGTRVDRMVLTADGKDGWASGAVHVSESESTPLLWRFQNGIWRNARNSFTPTTAIFDITMNASGSDGWMSTYDTAADETQLLRLRNGAWNAVDGPADGKLDHLGISPDGHYAWAVGISQANEGLEDGAFRWDGSRWITLPGTLYPNPDFTHQVTVDNSGNGWLVAVPFRQGILHSSLVRLTPGGTREIPLNLPGMDLDAGHTLTLSAVEVDGLGRGYAVGYITLDEHEEPGALRTDYRPVIIRLDGDTATPLDLTTVGGDPQDTNTGITVVGRTPSGTHTWVAGSDGVGRGGATEIPEPWAHATPEAATPLAGAGQCFAAVPHCLRGVFATYWATHGGLAQFGYPITPEVREQQGDSTYTVQYTERARLEWHPEYAGSANEVLLGLLGNTLADPRANEPPFAAAPALRQAGSQFFNETQHNVGPPFLAYWTRTGGLPVYGLPRSEAFDEVNRADGKTYRVQYFERNRIEHHPEFAGTPFEYLLGLLGVEQFTATYGYTP